MRFKGLPRNTFTFCGRPPGPPGWPGASDENWVRRPSHAGLRPGGFGILLAKQVVDEMFYNERRNEVLLIKHLAPYRDEEGNAVLR